MGQIKAIITDFDGTLVDTLVANTLAYKETFDELGYAFLVEKYTNLFGLRLDDMLKEMKIPLEKKEEIKQLKSKKYKNHYKDTIINTSLLEFIRYMHNNGVKTCIASTASKENLLGLLDFYNISNIIDYVICGEDVKNGKPDPEVYDMALRLCGVDADEALVFEDSVVGCMAAMNAKTNFMTIRTF